VQRTGVRVTSIKNYIAIVFLGIFVFPMVYQPYHIVVHHSEEILCHHTCCHTETEQSSDVQFKIFSENDEPCPICNYHFPIKNLPKVFHFTSSLAVFEGFINPLQQIRIYQQLVSIKIPRAPPL